MKGVPARITRGLTKGSRVQCIDNSGARIVEIIGVRNYHGTHRRYPAGGVGDLVVASVKKGRPEMKKEVVNAVIVRQKRPYRRPDGIVVSFESNAVVVTNDKGELRGTTIKGPVAREAAERWPTIAAASTVIV
jgi:large subunit ribosomal protein L14